MRIERSGADAREDVDDVRVDRVLPVRAGDGDPVVPVRHEVGVADAVDLDRRERLAAPGRASAMRSQRGAHAP